jgi:hypothetical protein
MHGMNVSCCEAWMAGEGAGLNRSGVLKKFRVELSLFVPI